MEKKEKQTKRTKVREAGYKKPVSKYEGVETQLDPFLRALVRYEKKVSLVRLLYKNKSRFHLPSKLHLINQ